MRDEESDARDIVRAAAAVLVIPAVVLSICAWWTGASMAGMVAIYLAIGAVRRRAGAAAVQAQAWLGGRTPAAGTDTNQSPHDFVTAQGNGKST